MRVKGHAFRRAAAGARESGFKAAEGISLGA